MPHTVVTDKLLDPVMIELSDINLSTSMQAVMITSEPVVLPDKVTFAPSLRTGLPPPRSQSQRQCILACVKRNALATDSTLDTDFVHDVAALEASCHRLLFVDDSLSLMEQYRDDPYSISRQTVKSWLARQDDATANEARRLMNLCGVGRDFLADQDLSVLDMFLRIEIKPETTDESRTSIPAGQTVMHSNKLFNMFFGPYVDVFLERFESLLRPCVLINRRKNISALEEFFSRHLGDDHDYVVLEDDVSKYDKSMLHLAWEIISHFARRMGVYDETFMRYLYLQVATYTVGRRSGVALSRIFQRHSGLPDTTAFNCVIRVVSAAAMLYDVIPAAIKCITILGDDITMWLKPLLIDAQMIAQRATTLLPNALNLTIKIFLYKYAYFCGYFIAHIGSRCHLISNPLRRAVKLGRSDLSSEDVIREYFTSFADSLVNYEKQDVVDYCVEALYERQPATRDAPLHLLMAALHHLRDNYSSFRRLWAPELSTIPYGHTYQNRNKTNANLSLTQLKPLGL